MNHLRLTITLFAASAGLVAIAPKASADEWNKKTIVTISEPVEVPGVVLQPGTYVFKLVGSQSDRHIVTIQNERMDHTYATILALPDYRLDPTGKTVFTFWETPAGQPKAIRAWFFPGDNFGQGFPKPKHPITVAARQAPEPPPAPVAPPPAPVEVAQNTPPPAPEPVEIAQNTPPPAPEPPPAEIETPRTIPQTAGNLPMLALTGVGLIGLALGIGAFARRLN